MNKAELVDEIKRLSGEDWSKAYAERVLGVVLEAIMSGLKDTKSVQLIGFGTFSVSKRAARFGVNPKTKARIQIPASQTVKFKVGSKFKEKVCD
ncbi:MAG: HU family DNA-binding protein [Puniceicoccales bacterium]|jgi:nucleoid DNA-binding protein|nr:HU family DNA-binding protein [Puniceicoccales bacterium]